MNYKISLFAENNLNIMKRLTAKEEEIMGFFWKEGPMFMKRV